MTDNELRAIEAELKREQFPGIGVIQQDKVLALVAEVRRLWELIRNGYELGVKATANSDYNGHCLWCQTDSTGYGPTHMLTCPVFSPTGEIK